MIPVEGHKNLFRDEKTGAIVNCDNTGYTDYMSQRRRQLDERAELDMMKNCLLYTSPSPRDLSTSRMPSSA